MCDLVLFVRFHACACACACASAAPLALLVTLLFFQAHLFVRAFVQQKYHKGAIKAPTLPQKLEMFCNALVVSHPFPGLLPLRTLVTFGTCRFVLRLPLQFCLLCPLLLIPSRCHRAEAQGLAGEAAPGRLANLCRRFLFCCFRWCCGRAWVSDISDWHPWYASSCCSFVVAVLSCFLVVHVRESLL